MVPKNTASNQTTPIHALSHQDSRLLTTGHRLSPSVPSRRLPSLDMQDQPTTSYPALLSTQLVGLDMSTSQEPTASQLSPTEVSPPGLSPERAYMASPTASAPFSGSLPSVVDILQSTPNPRPNPCSQNVIPTTYVSTYSRFEQSSPAISDPGNPHPPFGTMDLADTLPGIASARISQKETPWTRVTMPPENPPLPGLIPCILDWKSGSSSQAEKRRANSDASRRFRDRKRNEMQMEQKIMAQQDEIQKQSDTLQRQAQEIQALLQERDFYRDERDFYREHIARLLPLNQLPVRPASPRRSNEAFWPSLS